MNRLRSYLLITFFLVHGQKTDVAFPGTTTSCKKPAMTNMTTLSQDTEYYDKGSMITMWCKSGYYPPSSTMTCVKPGTINEWSPAVTCTGVTVTDERVTSSSISLRVSCTPECPDSWEYIVECYRVQDEMLLSCGTQNYGEGRSVTLTGLQPHSLYRVTSKIAILSRGYTLQTRDIRTEDSDTTGNTTEGSFRVALLPLSLGLISALLALKLLALVALVITSMLWSTMKKTVAPCRPSLNPIDS